MNFHSCDVNLFKTLCESTDENKNIFFSPLIVSNALSVLLLGSNGSTKQQLEEALGIVKDEELFEKLKALNNFLNYDSEVFKVTNPIISSTAFKIVSKFLSSIKNYFLFYNPEFEL